MTDTLFSKDTKGKIKYIYHVRVYDGSGKLLHKQILYRRDISGFLKYLDSFYQDWHSYTLVKYGKQ